MDVADPLEKTRVGKEENFYAGRREHGLARRFMEARVKRDLDAVDDILAPDFVNQNKPLPDQESDREGYKRAISAFHAAFSEGRLIIEDQVAGGTRW
jgi:hypothetical protein